MIQKPEEGGGNYNKQIDDNCSEKDMFDFPKFRCPTSLFREIKPVDLKTELVTKNPKMLYSAAVKTAHVFQRYFYITSYIILNCLTVGLFFLGDFLHNRQTAVEKREKEKIAKADLNIIRPVSYFPKDDIVVEYEPIINKKKPKK